MKAPLLYGGAPVPFTAAWTGESRFFVDHCAFARQRAICQEIAPGAGKPTFGKPHTQRQREAIVAGLCDLCGGSLRNRTKMSLSHARPRANGANGLAVLQVEALLHRDCAAICLRYCPSLKADIARGSLHVRQVRRHGVQLAIVDPRHLGEYVPGFEARSTDRIVGHAKVELIAWADRDAAWLGEMRDGGARA